MWLCIQCQGQRGLDTCCILCTVRLLFSLSMSSCVYHHVTIQRLLSIQDAETKINSPRIRHGTGCMLVGVHGELFVLMWRFVALSAVHT